MPTINKPKRKSTSEKHGKSKDIAKIYNSSKWVKLRNAYIQANPLCELCLEKEIIKPAEEVHHIKPIGTGLDELEMMDLAYNPENLKALCKECHHEIHQEMNKNIKNTPENP